MDRVLCISVRNFKLDQHRDRLAGSVLRIRTGIRNDEVHLRQDVSARAEMGCPHFAGIFAMDASVELMQSIGVREIEARALELNRLLTGRLEEIGWRVLSPLGEV